MYYVYIVYVKCILCVYLHMYLYVGDGRFEPQKRSGYDCQKEAQLVCGWGVARPGAPGFKSWGLGGNPSLDGGPTTRK